MLIRLEGVTRTYATGAAEVHALVGVDLEIRAGELVAITGASGSGKSTALNVLGTLDRPSSDYFFLITSRSSPRRHGALASATISSTVFQSYLLACDRRRRCGAAVICAGLRRGNVASARRGRSKRRPRDRRIIFNPASGGAQRVAIARAIVKSCLLLADAHGRARLGAPRA
jgi:putative ABC transport system ATP-binding protein